MNGKCSKRESKYNVLCIRVLLCIIILQHDCLHKLTKIHWDVEEGGGGNAHLQPPSYLERGRFSGSFFVCPVFITFMGNE